jgi:hypothetical protein
MSLGKSKGRDMGGIMGEMTGGMKFRRSLYLKGFREVDGRD